MTRLAFISFLVIHLWKARCVPLPNTNQTAELNNATSPVVLKTDVGMQSLVTTQFATERSVVAQNGPPKLSYISKRQDSTNSVSNITTGIDKLGYIRSDGTYILEDRAGVPCVMAYFKSKLTIYYPTKKEGKYESVILYPPNDVEVSGTCDRDNLEAILKLTWKDGIFMLTFKYDDLLDSWYVGRFNFKFDTTTPKFKNAKEEKTVVLASNPKRRWWTTSHARSFRCLLLHDVSLSDDNETYSATIHFDEARVQALTRSTTFKTPKHCIHRVHRDERVPAIVGGLVAASSVLTICGYAIFRYFKIKKFQYGTME